jgi:PBP1b-binding outer membrane lipoprotein LpoB
MKILILFLALMLGGCSMFGPLETATPMSVPTTLPEAGRQAQLAINEANLALTAAANVIAANVKDGIWTKAQAQGYLDKVREYAKQVDRAQEAVRLGQFSTAQAQANAVQALILILHREAAAQARKESAK